MNLKIGQELKYQNGSGSRWVLEVLTQSVLLSGNGKKEISEGWYTFAEIEDLFIVPKEKWVPADGERYYLVYCDGEIE